MDTLLALDLSRLVTCLALAIPRIQLALLFVPLMALKETRGLLKSSVVIAVGLPVAASNFYSLDVSSIGAVGMVMLLIKEATIGIVLGVLLSLPFHLFSSIGFIIDNQRGATSGQAFDPALGNTSFLGLFMEKAFTVMIIEVGLFSLIFGLLIHTYVLWPSWEFFPEPLTSGQLLLSDYFSDMTRKIMLYVLPILIIMLLIDLAFAILGLFSPQLQIYFIAMPAKTLVALFGLALYASSLYYYGQLEMEKILDLQSLLPTLFRVGGHHE
jgi:type III secretion protein T